jgi:RNA polymerase sigma-70 factor (ECF subfamily)
MSRTDPTAEVPFEDTLATDTTADADIDRAAEAGRLEAALLALPDHQRVPLVLYHFEDTSYQDIAAALGVSMAKVRSDIHRGRAALRRILGGVPS